MPKPTWSSAGSVQTGTHEGELFDIAPTGRRVDFGEMAICQFAGGQIVSTWFQTDMLALMSQLMGRRLDGGPDEAEAPASPATKRVDGEQPAAPVPS